jgi:nitrous oxidase accessory protein NosD
VTGSIRIASSVFAALAALASVAPAVANADAIDVFPGQNAIQRAIDRAHAGDKLRIHGGTYKGQVVVDKRLRLVGVDGRPKIDGQCNTKHIGPSPATATLYVQHSGVVLRHLRVVGVEGGVLPSEVDFEHNTHGKAKDLKVFNTCDEAEYGINVFNTGDLKIVGNVGSGFEDAAFYIGGITNTAGGVLNVQGNTAYGNSRGIIVEDTTNGPAVDVRITGNDMRSNTIVGSEGPSDGLFLHNADGLLVTGNRSTGNGAYGFHAGDAGLQGSTGNCFTGNVASANGLGAYHQDTHSTPNFGSNNTPSFGLAACP